MVNVQMKELNQNAMAKVKMTDLTPFFLSGGMTHKWVLIGRLKVS